MQLETSRIPYSGETIQVKYNLEAAFPDAQQITAICNNNDLESLPILHRWLEKSLVEWSRSEDGVRVPITPHTVSALPNSLASSIAREIVERLGRRGFPLAS